MQLALHILATIQEEDLPHLGPQDILRRDIGGHKSIG